MKEKLEQIEKIEHDAEQTVAAAESKAADMLAEADREARKLVEDAEVDAEEQAGKMIEEAEASATGEVEAIRRAGETEHAGVASEVQERIGSVVDSLVKRLMQ